MSGQLDDTPIGLARPQLRALQHDLLGARDQQILQVVAMVDALPARGEADQFITALRPRLAILHPVRPLSFTRLLFLPLDPLIVAPSAWRRDALAVPRSVLLPLARLVRAAMTDQAAEIDRALVGLSTEHDRQIAETGPALWGEGGTLLASATVPPNWVDATGLQPADFRTIVDIAAPILLHAARLQHVTQLGTEGEATRRRDLDLLLQSIVTDGPGAFAALTALLAERLPRADQVFFIADDIAARQGDPALRNAVDRAIDATIDGLELTAGQLQRLDQASTALRHLVAVLEDLDAQCNQRPSRKARIAQLRLGIDTASRKQFSTAMETHILHPAAMIAEADDHQIASMEASARDLRRFEVIARRLGGAEHYDRQLKGAATELRPKQGELVQTMIDRIRLIEILLGPEAAIAAFPG